MNTSEYISSGILESYALGLCNATEAADVERMCTLYPEIKAELEDIQSSLGGYVQAHAVNPPESVKASIFNKINELEKAEEYTTPKTETKVIPLVPPASNQNTYKYFAAASLVLLGLSVIGNIVFYGKWKQANEQVIALNNEKNVLADGLKTNTVRLNNMQQSLAVMSNPDISRVMMKGVEKSPESLAVIYWNKQSKEVYVEVKNLPKLEDGKQYQLWAIVDGKPVDAGMLPLNESDSTMIKMKDFESAQAFAITIEKAGGSPSPTLEQMVVMGATNG